MRLSQKIKSESTTFTSQTDPLFNIHKQHFQYSTLNVARSHFAVLQINISAHKSVRLTYWRVFRVRVFVSVSLQIQCLVRSLARYLLSIKYVASSGFFEIK